MLFRLVTGFLIISKSSRAFGISVGSVWACREWKICISFYYVRKHLQWHFFDPVCVCGKEVEFKLNCDECQTPHQMQCLQVRTSAYINNAHCNFIVTPHLHCLTCPPPAPNGSCNCNWYQLLGCDMHWWCSGVPLTIHGLRRPHSPRSPMHLWSVGKMGGPCLLLVTWTLHSMLCQMFTTIPYQLEHILSVSQSDPSFLKLKLSAVRRFSWPHYLAGMWQKTN